MTAEREQTLLTIISKQEEIIRLLKEQVAILGTALSARILR
jgi:hypothetical protein